MNESWSYTARIAGHNILYKRFQLFGCNTWLQNLCLSMSHQTPCQQRNPSKRRVADKPWQVAANTALAQTVSLQSCIYMLQPECCLLSSNVM